MKLIGANAIKLSKTRKTYPFEDASVFEDCAQKTGCSIFVYASHSKKRANNITFVRLYDNQVLDLVEVGITNIIPMDELKNKKSEYGLKPLILFTGSEFAYGDEMRCYKEMLLDMFHRDPQVDLYDLKGIDTVITFTVTGAKTVDMRVYKVLFKKSQSKLPRVELEEIGPRIETEIRRIKFANRKALKIPSILMEYRKGKKIKNTSRNAMGDKLGKVYPQAQDIYSLQIRKVKALKRQKLAKIKEAAQDKS